MLNCTPEQVAAWCGASWFPRAPAKVRGVSIDTRSLSHDALFVALKGAQTDGHAFVAEAKAKGACGAVVDRAAGVAMPRDLPLLRVADPLRALQGLAAAYRRSCSATVVAITGSAGKSTVKELIADMLERHGRTARTVGNWNNHIGLPLSILAMEPRARFGVFEIGINHPGEMEPLCDLLQPDHGVITSIGPSHVEHFGSVEAIAEEKARLLAHVPACGKVVCPADDPFFPNLAAAARGAVITTSMEGPADYAGERAKRTLHRLTVREALSGDCETLSLPVEGAFFARDVLLAVAVARSLGVSWASVTRALAAYRGMPQRWERRGINGVLFIDDSYNANPISMRASLQAFEELAGPGKKWMVLGGMLELGEEEEQHHRRVGQDAARMDVAGLLAVGRRGGWIADGALEHRMDADRVFRCPDVEAAAAVLADRAVGGDFVLVKASRGERIDRTISAWTRRREAPHVHA